jgi:hypothetical protein
MRSARGARFAAGIRRAGVTLAADTQALAGAAAVRIPLGRDCP